MLFCCLALFLTAFPSIGLGEYCFPGAAWDDPCMQSILGELVQEAALTVPAEFEVCGKFSPKTDFSLQEDPDFLNDLRKQCVSPERSLLQPLKPYLETRWTKAILRRIENGLLDVFLVEGDYFAGLGIMAKKKYLPLAEILPSKPSGVHLILAWEPLKKTIAVWSIGIDCHSLLLHHFAMVHAAAPKRSASFHVFRAGRSAIDMKEALKAFPFTSPDLWVIGFRDTMAYMISEREQYRKKAQKLQREFGDNVNEGIVGSITIEITQKKFLADHFAWQTLKDVVVRLPAFTFDENGFLQSDWFWKAKDFFQAARKIADNSRYCKSLWKVQEILRGKPWEDSAESADFCFLPHQNLFLKIVRYIKKDGTQGTIALLENPYGDQALELIRAVGKTFPNPKVLYLGTAGSLIPQLSFGTLVGPKSGIPDELISVSTPVSEVHETLAEFAKNGKTMIDVESSWLKQGLTENPQIHFSGMFLIADAPLEKITLQDWEHRKLLMNQSFEKMVDQIIREGEVHRFLDPCVDTETQHRNFLSARKNQLRSLKGSSLSDSEIDRLLERERDRRLLSTWLSPYRSPYRSPHSNSSIRQAWWDFFRRAEIHGHAVAGIVSEKKQISPILGERIFAWKCDRDFLKLTFTVREPAEKSFLAWLKRQFNGLSNSRPAVKITPGGNTIYRKSREFFGESHRVRFYYTPHENSSLDEEAFLNDRGRSWVSFRVSSMKAAVSIMTELSLKYDLYPDMTDLCQEQIPLPNLKIPLPETVLFGSHKMTRNRNCADVEEKLALDIADVVQFVKHLRLLSARRRLEEGKVLETTKVRMNEIDDSDIGSGQNHLVYMSLGSGINYYDVPWQSKNKGLPSPRLIFRNVFSNALFTEYYPRNSWDTLSKGYSRYAEILSFQGDRFSETVMSPSRRSKFLHDLSLALCEQGIANAEVAEKAEFRFWNLTGAGNFINNEIRVPEEADLDNLIVGIAVPKGTGNAYKSALSRAGFSPEIVFEAPLEGDRGMRLAYMQCLADRKFPCAGRLLHVAVGKPLLWQKLEKVVNELVFENIDNEQ